MLDVERSDIHPDSRLAISPNGLFAVLASPISIRAVRIRDSSMVAPEPLETAIALSKGLARPDVLVVGESSVPPLVAVAYPDGTVWVGHPGNQMEDLNPGIGPVTALWVGTRPGILAPVWLAGGRSGVIAAQSPERMLLSGHSGAILDLRFSADFTMLLSGSQDGTARLWRLPDGACMVLPAGSPVLKVAWAENRKGALTVSADGSVRTWQIGDFGNSIPDVPSYGGKSAS